MALFYSTRPVPGFEEESWRKKAYCNMHLYKCNAQVYIPCQMRLADLPEAGRITTKILLVFLSLKVAVCVQFVLLIR